MKPDPGLALFARTIGTWNVTGSHPHLPGRTLRGRVTFENADGGAFVRMHSKMDDPDIPDGIAVLGTDGDDGTCCTMPYFDEREVARRYEVAIDADGITWSRDATKLTQRFRNTIAADARRMEGEGTMKREGGSWEPGPWRPVRRSVTRDRGAS